MLDDEKRAEADKVHQEEVSAHGQIRASAKPANRRHANTSGEHRCAKRINRIPRTFIRRMTQPVVQN